MTADAVNVHVHGPARFVTVGPPWTDRPHPSQIRDARLAGGGQVLTPGPVPARQRGGEVARRARSTSTGCSSGRGGDPASDELPGDLGPGDHRRRPTGRLPATRSDQVGSARIAGDVSGTTSGSRCLTSRSANSPERSCLVEKGFFLGSHARNTVLSPQHEDVSLLPGRFFRPAGRCSGPW